MRKKELVSGAVVSRLDEMFKGWLELGGKIESFPEINSVDLEIIFSLGALYTGENLLLTGEFQVSERTSPWVIKSLYW